MKNLVVVLLALAFTGCTGSSSTPSPWCQFVVPIDQTLVNNIVADLSCTNPAAVLASFQAIEKCSLSSTSPSPTPAATAAAMQALSSGPLSTICSAVAPAVIAAVVPAVEGAVIPSSWGCSPTSTVSALEADAVSLCGLIPAVKEQAHH